MPLPTRVSSQASRTLSARVTAQYSDGPSAVTLSNASSDQQRMPRSRMLAKLRQATDLYKPVPTNGFPGIYFNNVGDKLKLMEVQNWGTGRWYTFLGAFHGCNNMRITATDSATAKTAGVSVWDRAFTTCTSLTSFPHMDMSGGVNFTSCWNGCNNITALPGTLDFSNGTTFTFCWTGMASLTSFPSTYNFNKATTIRGAWSNHKWTSFPPYDFPKVTSAQSAWSGCSEITSFPLIDLSNCTNFSSTWDGCSKLVSFPLINTSKGTNFFRAWNGCSKLVQMAPISFRSMTSADGPFWGCTLLVNHPDYEMPIANSLSLNNFFRSSGISAASYSRFLERLNAVNPSNTGSITQTPQRYISGPASIARAAMIARGWTVGDSGVVAGLITTVNTSNPGSPSNQYVLPLNPDLTYNFAVNWGDSQGEYVTNQTPGFPNITHTYAVAGSKTVTLTEVSVGGLPSLFFNNQGDRRKLTAITQWGNNTWLRMQASFFGCSNLNITAADFATAKLNTVTNFRSAFQGCSSLVTLNSYNLSAGTDFTRAWMGCSALVTVGASLNLGGAQVLTSAFAGCSSLVTFPVIALPNMVNGITMFNGAALSTTSYSNLLINLNTVNSNLGVTFDGGAAKYNVGSAAARTNLITVKGWNITDGGPA